MKPNIHDVREALAKTKMSSFNLIKCIEEVTQEGSKRLEVFAKDVREDDGQTRNSSRVQR